MVTLKGVGPKKFKKFAGVEFWSKNDRKDGTVEFGRPMASDVFDVEMPKIVKRVEACGLRVLGTHKGTMQRNAFESTSGGFILVAEA